MGVPRRKDVSWMDVQVDWINGEMPLRAIAQKHGISIGAIQNYAKRHAWAKELRKGNTQLPTAAGRMVELVPTTPERWEEVTQQRTSAIFAVLEDHRKLIGQGRR